MNRRCIVATIRVMLLCMLAGLVGGVAEDAIAASGQRIQLPAPPNKPRNFLSAMLDTRWVEGTGYRPVAVTLNSLRGVVTSDRTIRVEISVRGNWQSRFMPIVSQEITIPEGKTQIADRILIPQDEGFGWTRVRFFERGGELKELRFEQWFGMNSNYQWSEAAPAVLVIDSKAPPNALRPVTFAGMGAAGTSSVRESELAPFEVPDIRPLARTIGMYNNALTRSDPSKVELLNHINQLPRLEILPPAELPKKWLAYSCCNVIVISLSDLQALKDSEPEKVQALREWAATGMTLCVHGVGEGFHRLGACERLLELREIRGAARNGWKDPSNRDFTAFYGYDLSQNNGEWVTINGQQQWLTGQQLRKHRLGEASRSDKRTKVQIETQRRNSTFIHRDLGLGHVVAMATETPFPGERNQWDWIFRTLDRNNHKWYQRYGMSMHRDNPDYWNWLIPGVGLPPVISFLVLITVFVIVIGPFNYFFLRRARRLYLLLVTVPLGALLVTCSLLLYAMVMDGFGTKSRIRSVTTIDQPSNVAVTWSRQTYYSSLAPSRGLVYPTYAAIYPIRPLPAEEYDRISGSRYINWGENQVLRRGYMRSRTPAQFMVVSAQPSLAEMLINEDTATADNRLGTDVSLLVVRDSAGNFLVGEDLRDGQTARLKPLDAKALSDINTRLVMKFNESRPANPEGFQRSEYTNSYMYRNRRRYSYIDQNEQPPRYGTSVLERQLALANGKINQLQRRSYLALVEVSPEVPLGIEGTQEFSSFEVIIGKW